MQNKNAKRESDRRRYYRRKQLMHEYLGNQCTICGSVDDLEIDHKQKSEKSFALSKIYNYKWETILPELNKCQLLCHKHHQDKNKIDNGEAVHGSLTMYSHHRCRCTLCRDTWSQWHSNRKAVRGVTD